MSKRSASMVTNLLFQTTQWYNFTRIPKGFPCRRSVILNKILIDYSYPYPLVRHGIAKYEYLPIQVRALFNF